jgi:hypothetical protein
MYGHPKVPGLVYIGAIIPKRHHDIRQIDIQQSNTL